MSLITRRASTDVQEQALASVLEWAGKLNIKLFYGTSIGKAPQTVILDRNYQDGLVYVNAEGDIRVNGETVCDFVEFKKMMGK
jgi:hypothetical protein